MTQETPEEIKLSPWCEAGGQPRPFRGTHRQRCPICARFIPGRAGDVVGREVWARHKPQLAPRKPRPPAPEYQPGQRCPFKLWRPGGRVECGGRLHAVAAIGGHRIGFQCGRCGKSCGIRRGARAGERSEADG